MSRLTASAFLIALAALPLGAQSASGDSTAKPAAADSAKALPATPDRAGEEGGGSVRPCIQRGPDGTCDTRWRPDNGETATERCVDKDLNGSCDEPEGRRGRGFWSGIGGFVAGLFSDRQKTESEKAGERGTSGVRKRPLGAPRD